MKKKTYLGWRRITVSVSTNLQSLWKENFARFHPDNQLAIFHPSKQVLCSYPCTVCNYKKTPANVDQYNLVSDWLNDTISLKNMLNERHINPAPHIPYTCMVQEKIIYCYERWVVKQGRKSLQPSCFNFI